jgi:hypothetical protein
MNGSLSRVGLELLATIALMAPHERENHLAPGGSVGRTRSCPADLAPTYREKRFPLALGLLRRCPVYGRRRWTICTGSTLFRSVSLAAVCPELGSVRMNSWSVTCTIR